MGSGEARTALTVIEWWPWVTPGKNGHGRTPGGVGSEAGEKHGEHHSETLVFEAP